MDVREAQICFNRKIFQVSPRATHRRSSQKLKPEAKFFPKIASLVELFYVTGRIFCRKSSETLGFS